LTIQETTGNSNPQAPNTILLPVTSTNPILFFTSEEERKEDDDHELDEEPVLLRLHAFSKAMVSLEAFLDRVAFANICCMTGQSVTDCEVAVVQDSMNKCSSNSSLYISATMYVNFNKTFFVFLRSVMN